MSISKHGGHPPMPECDHDECGQKCKRELASSAGSAIFAKWSPCIYMGALLCDDCVKGNMDDPDARCDMATGRRQHQRAFQQGYAQGQNDKALPRGGEKETPDAKKS